MPVAIAKVDRQMRAAVGEFPRESGYERAVLSVDGSSAVERVVVLGDLQQALARHIPAAQDIFQKWDHVFAALRSAEGD